MEKPIKNKIKNILKAVGIALIVGNAFFSGLLFNKINNNQENIYINQTIEQTDLTYLNNSIDFLNYELNELELEIIYLKEMNIKLNESLFYLENKHITEEKPKTPQINPNELNKRILEQLNQTHILI